MGSEVFQRTIGQATQPSALDVFTDTAAAGDAALLRGGTTVSDDALARSCSVLIEGAVPAPASAITIGITSGSKAATAVAKTITFGVGASVTGTGIPAGTTVASITSDTAFTLSQAATATNASASLTFGAGKGTFMVPACRHL